jgi:hypothetical protein
LLRKICCVGAITGIAFRACASRHRDYDCTWLDAYWLTLNAEFRGKYLQEYLWFSLGAATPLISIDAAKAARSIVRSTMCRDKEKILSVPADVLARFRDISPENHCIRPELHKPVATIC